MNRDISGVNGQYVTTWGSEVVDGIVLLGTERPLTTRLTCRCGKSRTYKGFPSSEYDKRAGFIEPLAPEKGKIREQFCSEACVLRYDGTRYREQLRSEMEHCEWLYTQAARAFNELPEEDAVEVFLSKLYELHRKGSTEEALQHIFLWVDNDLATSKQSDAMLQRVDENALDEDLIVGLLTATYRGREWIPSRTAFAERARIRLGSEIGQEECGALDLARLVAEE